MKSKFDLVEWVGQPEFVCEFPKPKDFTDPLTRLAHENDFDFIQR